MGRTEEVSGDRAHMGGLTCCNTGVREVCEKVFSVKLRHFFLSVRKLRNET